MPPREITTNMPRDTDLEELLHDDLRSHPNITNKAMFGGGHGNLLCAARDNGMSARLGKEHDARALQILGIVPMILRVVHLSVAA